MRRQTAFRAVLSVTVAAIAVFGLYTFNLKPAAGEAPTARVLAALLTVTPATSVPNQSIIVSGTGFTPAITPGGFGPNGVHQITGEGFSFVKVAGLQWGSPHVPYPINLDSGGGLATNVVVPVTQATLSAGTVVVEVADDQGATASATLTIPQRSLTLSPTTSERGSTVTVNGTGFPASNIGLTGFFPVSLDYAGESLGIVTPDSSGSFETTFAVPLSASIPSSNAVTATLLDKPATATATHSVPPTSITLTPASGPPGTSVTVIGASFPAFAPVTSVTFSGIQALPGSTNTDRDGGFTLTAQLPQLPTGNQTVVASAGGFTAVSLFTVAASSQVPTRTPTPTPKPTVTPAVGLAPLISEDNLVVMWLFETTTKEWLFFHPTPSFARFNEVTELVEGEVYDLEIRRDATVTLNGKSRTLTCVNDNCWNSIAW